MEVQQHNWTIKHTEEKNRFYIDLADHGTAYLEYRLVTNTAPTTIEFTHTFVPKSMRNQGIASKIVKHGLEYAQDKSYQINPICPFVEAYMEDHPEFKK